MHTLCAHLCELCAPTHSCVCTLLLHSLFAPLTGIEVLGTHVEGSVLIVEVGLSINLASLTIDQVLSKRRKVVVDMCDQLRLKFSQDTTGTLWSTVNAAVPASKASDIFARSLRQFEGNDSEFYNDDAALGDAIRGAVSVASNAASWPDSLEILAVKVRMTVQVR